MKEKAFTLSEVLIALVLVGVVATITIPTFMTYVQKQETVTKLKKAYSVLHQAYKLSVVDNGDVVHWEFGKNTFNWSESRKFLEKYFIPYIQITKDLKYEAGSVAPEQFVLLDGMVLDADVRLETADLIVDLNGSRKPNRRGRDIFVIRVSQAENYKDFGFAGAVYNRDGIIKNYHGCSHSASGSKYTYCGALIQADNWQIKGDYPW